MALDHITRLLQMATKKRSLNALAGIGSIASAAAAADGGSQVSSELGTEEAIKVFIAKSIATVLVTTGRAAISDEDLESLVEETMRLMAGDYVPGAETKDPAAMVGRVARSYAAAAERDRELLLQQETAAQLAVASLPLLLSSARASTAAQATAVAPPPPQPGKNGTTELSRRPMYDNDIDDGGEDAEIVATTGPAYITPVYTGLDLGKQQVTTCRM